MTLEERLKQLPQSADALAADVQADDQLYRKIREEAARGAAPRTRRQRWIPAAALAAAAALLFFLIPRSGAPAPLNIESVTAGGSDSLLSTPATRADLPAGSVSIESADSVPAFRELWSGNSDSRFPMVLINGAYYRLLSSPRQLKNSQLAAEAGTVSQYTSEMTGSGLCSNTVLAGETVWYVRGMGEAAVAARVDGALRVFQRVTAGGQGAPGSLAEAIPQSGVTELSLSGVGRIRDAGTAQQLVGALVAQADRQGGGCRKTGQVLHITYASGVTLQLYVQDNTLAGPGTWSCPAFFTQFQQAAQ